MDRSASVGRRSGPFSHLLLGHHLHDAAEAVRDRLGGIAGPVGLESKDRDLVIFSALGRLTDSPAWVTDL